MTSVESKISFLFMEAAKLNSELWLDENCIDSSRMSVVDFADFVQRAHNVTISFRRVQSNNTHVLGHVERYKDGAEIIIYTASNITPFERRYVEVKEICQIVLDSRSDWSVNGRDTLERLANPIIVDMGADENTALLSEETAQLLAHELLYPIETRLADLERLRQALVTEDEISNTLEIPVELVRSLLAPHVINWSQRGWERKR